jgi:3-deoxy-manno-octulosonate cytidylyltransferase (CMP-KDO synthetase)
MRFTVIIPARFGSTRLPGKPLRDIAGKPMIQRVWEQAGESAAERVVIATDDPRIEAAAREFGAEVCMTRADHPSGTDRLQEVAALLGLTDDAIVVNVQGDEPLIPPAVINQVASNLAANTQAGVATLAEPIETYADLRNPNVVKLVTNQKSMALYFSRAPIPWPRDVINEANAEALLPKDYEFTRHIGIYAYRVKELNDFVTWPVAPIEATEKLEQLRFMWQGVVIHAAPALQPVPGGIDTEEDLQAVIRLLESM